MTDPDANEGFTVSEKFQKRFEKQRERVERMEEDFKAELAREMKKNRAKLAKEFMDYAHRNPEGARAKVSTVWGGYADDYTGFDRLAQAAAEDDSE